MTFPNNSMIQSSIIKYVLLLKFAISERECLEGIKGKVVMVNPQIVDKMCKTGGLPI